MKTGVELIAEERKEQIEKHGYSQRHDNEYLNDELKYASMYALEPCAFTASRFDWLGFQDKINGKTTIDRLKIAGALIAAEIDRIQSE